MTLKIGGGGGGGGGGDGVCLQIHANRLSYAPVIYNHDPPAPEQGGDNQANVLYFLFLNCPHIGDLIYLSKQSNSM